MRIAIVIPARLASTRFPAKPLAPLIGADGVAHPAISYTWAAAQAAAAALPGKVECVIATDDAGIADACAATGMAVVMTPETCLNGTERCAAALAGLAAVPDIVVNLQGDAPFTPAAMVAAVVEMLAARPELAISTAVVPATPCVRAHLQADAAACREGGPTALCHRAGPFS